MKANNYNIKIAFVAKLSTNIENIGLLNVCICEVFIEENVAFGGT
jgi:hypothetical protein